MIYSKNTALGDAGEFFFAYKVAKELKWPCRIFDIDIGIDAQVEVLDKDQRSTGKFVAVQIKSTDAKERMHVDIEIDKVEYWRGVQHPVFVVLVKFPACEIYLRRVDGGILTSPSSTTVRINFDIENTFSSAGAIFECAVNEKEVAIREQVETLRAKAVRDASCMKEACDDYERGMPESQVIVELVHRWFISSAELDKALIIAESHNLDCDVWDVSDAFEEQTSRLRDILMSGNFVVDHDHDREGRGRIREFIDINR